MLAELARGTATTWDALTDPAKHPPEAGVALPAELPQYKPERCVEFSTPAVAGALREARRGGAVGLSGMRAAREIAFAEPTAALELLTEEAAKLRTNQCPGRRRCRPGLAMAGLMTPTREPWPKNAPQGRDSSADRRTCRQCAGPPCFCAPVLVSLDGRSAYDSSAAQLS